MPASLNRNNIFRVIRLHLTKLKESTEKSVIIRTQANLFFTSFLSLLISPILIWNLANRVKKKIKNTYHTLGFQFFIKKLWHLVFGFSMWFARFQILICKPQSILCKLLLLSWLYLACECELFLFVSMFIIGVGSVI